MVEATALPFHRECSANECGRYGTAAVFDTAESIRNSEMVMSPFLFFSLLKKNMNHPRKLPQRAECPDT